MAKLTIIALAFLTACGSPPRKSTLRQNEFPIYDNGLIYDSTTMARLTRTVDSLNLRFKKCEPKNYSSLEQGYCTYLRVGADVARAKVAMNSGITLQDFIKKFPIDNTVNNCWVVKAHVNFNGEKKIDYHTKCQISFSLPYSSHHDKVEGWIYDELNDTLEILYLHKLNATAIPEEYGRLIQYVDCMIDTTATIFQTNRIPDSVLYNVEPNSKLKQFVDMANSFEPEPEEPEFVEDEDEFKKRQMQYEREHAAWLGRWTLALDEKMTDEKNQSLLHEALDEAIEKHNGIFLDYFGERYLSPEDQLRLKRSFRMTGSCSADIRPRTHALKIASLAAQMFQWDIFLRAHLDILNDNFERASDGSWAWGGRGTYMKELEALNIDAVEMLIGTTIASSGLNQNHYSASNYRIARALAQSKERTKAEDLLLRMVKDQRLDLHNRMEMAYTFIFYNEALPDKKEYAANLERIKSALETFPDALAERYALFFDNTK